MLAPSRLLRRVTLSLAGRLPTMEELNAVEHGDPVAIDTVLDSIMCEEAFYERLKEGFNDIFLTIGIEDNAETLLSYHHFEKTRRRAVPTGGYSPSLRWCSVCRGMQS